MCSQKGRSPHLFGAPGQPRPHDLPDLAKESTRFLLHGARLSFCSDFQKAQIAGSKTQRNPGGWRGQKMEWKFPPCDWFGGTTVSINNRQQISDVSYREE